MAMIVAFMEYMENANIKKNGFSPQTISNWKIQNRKKNLTRQ
jgi:hypothetical protein